MKISNVLILLALVFFAFKAPGCYSHAAATAKYAGLIKAKLNEEIANTACVPASSYPFSSVDRPGDRCPNCDKFVEAGLLTKQTVEDLFATDAQMARKAADIRYELTDIGYDAYVRGTADGPYGNDPPRFCFGKVRVNAITRTVGPVMNGNVKMLGIRYVAELENANSFMFDPRARLLGIPLPIGPALPGKPVLLPEANVTAVFDPVKPDDFYLDESLQIGQ